LKAKGKLQRPYGRRPEGRGQRTLWGGQFSGGASPQLRGDLRVQAGRWAYGTGLQVSTRTGARSATHSNKCAPHCHTVRHLLHYICLLRCTPPNHQLSLHTPPPPPPPLQLAANFPLPPITTTIARNSAACQHSLHTAHTRTWVHASASHASTRFRVARWNSFGNAMISFCRQRKEQHGSKSGVKWTTALIACTQNCRFLSCRALPSWKGQAVSKHRAKVWQANIYKHIHP